MKSFKNILRDRKLGRAHKMARKCTTNKVYYTLEHYLDKGLDRAFTYNVLFCIVNKLDGMDEII
jgi:hypothetical protein